MRRLVASGLACLVAIGVPLSGHAWAATVVASWPVGDRPTGVAVDPVDGRVYVANEGTVMPDGSGRVFVVDPASGAVSQIRTSGASDLLALDASARRLYSSNANRTVDVVDLATKNTVATFTVGGLGIAVDETTHNVYVAGASDLALIDGATNTIVTRRLAPVGQSWFGVALDAGLHRVYVTNINESEPSVVILDDRDLTVLGEIPLPLPARFALGVDPTRHLIYVGSYDGMGGNAKSALYVIDAQTRAIVHTTPLAGAFPSHLVVAPGSDHLFVTDMSGGRLFEVDDTSFVVRRVTTLPWNPGWAALHTDGRLYVGAWSADLLAAVRVANSAPVVDSLALHPSAPGTNDILTATVDAHDADGDALTLSYEWSWNGAVIVGATGATLDLSVAGNGDRGDTITVRATASDGQLSSSATASVDIVDTPPLVSLELNNPAPRTNENLAASVTLVDPDSESYRCALAYSVNGVPLFEVPFCTYTYSLSVHDYGDRGDRIDIRATVSDSRGTWQVVATATAIVADSEPVIAAPSLSDSTPASRDVLVASVTAFDVDGDAITFVYDWTVNGTSKRTTTSAATTDSFDLRPKGNGDNGDVITVTVVATDGALTSRSVSATATVTPGRNH